eukprot:6177980-Pleurochrysis_carterae.AAC.1
MPYCLHCIILDLLKGKCSTFKLNGQCLPADTQHSTLNRGHRRSVPSFFILAMSSYTISLLYRRTESEMNRQGGTARWLVCTPGTADIHDLDNRLSSRLHAMMHGTPPNTHLE